MIRAPGVSQAGGSCNLPVSLIDLYPTLIDLCGLPANTLKNAKGRPLDGHSLKPLLIDPVSGKWDGPDAVLTALYKWAKHYDPAEQSYTLRDRNWRYIRYQNGKEELYHVAEDRYEWANLALNPEYAAQLAPCRARLLARIPRSQPASTGTKTDAEAREDAFFKKHPEADADHDGILSWPEYKAYKAKLDSENTKKAPPQ